MIHYSLRLEKTTVLYEVRNLGYLQIWNFSRPNLVLSLIPAPFGHDSITLAKLMIKSFVFLCTRESTTRLRLIVCFLSRQSPVGKSVITVSLN